MTTKQRRVPVVVTVRHDRGNGRASVAPLAGLTDRSVEPDPPTSEPAEFDPSDHNIDDVESYVEANPDELDAVLAAERAGKDRSTLIEWLEARQETTETS